MGVVVLYIHAYYPGSSDQHIFTKLEGIIMDFRAFHRIYPSRILEQVIMDKRKEEGTLEGIISSNG